MTNSTNPIQDDLQEVLENLYDAQDSIKGTGTDPVRSRSAQIRKAREFIQAHTQLAVREALKRTLWVTLHDVPDEPRRIAGPFTSVEDASKAREILERFELHNNYWLEELQEDK